VFGKKSSYMNFADLSILGAFGEIGDFKPGFVRELLPKPVSV